MSEFIKLSAKQERHARRLALFQRLRRHHEVARQVELATVGIAHSIKRTSKAHTRHQLSWLAELTQHEAEAYTRLSHRVGAIRYCDAHIDHALRALELQETP